MKDKMTITGNNLPPKEFIEYLHLLIEEVGVNGERFDKYKKYLVNYCKEHSVNYNNIETEIITFINILSDNTINKNELYHAASKLYFSPQKTDTLLTKIQAKKKQEKHTKHKDDWEEAKRINTIHSYLNFTNKYTDGEYIYTAKQNLKNLKNAQEKIQNKKEELRRKEEELARKEHKLKIEKLKHSEEHKLKNNEIKKRDNLKAKQNMHLKNRVNSSMAWSVVSIFLGGIFGIIATVQSSKAKTRLEYGDINGCEQALKKSMTYRSISFVLVFIVAVIGIINN